MTRPGQKIKQTGVIALGEAPPFPEGEGHQPHQTNVVPEQCERCRSRLLHRDGFRVSCRNCAWDTYLVRADIPRPITPQGSPKARFGARPGQKARRDV